MIRDISGLYTAILCIGMGLVHVLKQTLLIPILHLKTTTYRFSVFPSFASFGIEFKAKTLRIRGNLNSGIAKTSTCTFRYEGRIQLSANGFQPLLPPGGSTNRSNTPPTHSREMHSLSVDERFSLPIYSRSCLRRSTNPGRLCPTRRLENCI